MKESILPTLTFIHPVVNFRSFSDVLVQTLSRAPVKAATGPSCMVFVERPGAHILETPPSRPPAAAAERTTPPAGGSRYCKQMII